MDEGAIRSLVPVVGQRPRPPVERDHHDPPAGRPIVASFV
jgi:hypothetical protein